jgi:hypothetical protein
MSNPPLVHIVRRVLPGPPPPSSPPPSSPPPLPAAPQRKLSHLLVVGTPLTPAHRTALSAHFATISHYPDRAAVPASAYASADAAFGFPQVAAFAEIPRMRLVQLASAGADYLLGNPMWKREGEARGVDVATAAGVHMIPISQVRAARAV